MMQDLNGLAAIINAEHGAGEEASRQALAHYRACGEALLQAKERCGHGHWLAWLASNVRFTEKRAQRYMRLAKSEVTSDVLV
jgi:hypothetical protein